MKKRQKYSKQLRGPRAGKVGKAGARHSGRAAPRPWWAGARGQGTPGREGDSASPHPGAGGEATGFGTVCQATVPPQEVLSMEQHKLALAAELRSVGEAGVLSPEHAGQGRREGSGCGRNSRTVASFSCDSGVSSSSHYGTQCRRARTCPKEQPGSVNRAGRGQG